MDKTMNSVAGQMLRGLSYLLAEIKAGDAARAVEAATRLLGAMDGYEADMRAAVAGSRWQIANRCIATTQDVRVAVGVARASVGSRVPERVTAAVAEIKLAVRRLNAAVEPYDKRKGDDTVDRSTGIAWY